MLSRVTVDVVGEPVCDSDQLRKTALPLYRRRIARLRLVGLAGDHRIDPKGPAASYE